MSNASKSFTSMQATRSHRRDVNGMVGQWSTFNQMRTFLREICVPLQPADPLKSTASAALQNGLMFQPHSESTSFTSMGSLVRVQLSPLPPVKKREGIFMPSRRFRLILSHSVDNLFPRHSEHGSYISCIPFRLLSWRPRGLPSQHRSAVFPPLM